LTDLRDYLRILRKRAGLILIAVVLCAAAALGASLATIPVYEAHAKLLLMARTQPGTGVSADYEATLLSQQLVQSFAAVIESRPTAEAALRRHPETITVGALQARINAEPIPDTLLIKLTVSDIDPARAQRLTNGVALAFINQVPQLQGGSTLRANVVEPALRPSVPVRPQTRFNVALAALLGLMLGVGVAFLADRLDTSIRGVEALEAAAGAPVVGTIPLFAAGKEALPVLRAPRSVEAEAFRKLRTNFSFLSVDRGTLCCVVSSPSMSEGKSTVTVNLAVALAQSGLRVIVVEADLRKPTVHRLFGLQDRVGTTTVLLERVDVDDALQPLEEAPVAVLTSGQLPPNPSELLGSGHMAELIQTLRQRADVILIDSAPVLPVTDPMVVSQFADAVLLIARAGTTSKDSVRSARAACDRAGVRVLGVVLNAAPVGEGPRGEYYGYYGYYGSRTAAEAEAEPTSNGTANGAGRRAGRHSKSGVGT